jgi:hypothetical protein
MKNIILSYDNLFNVNGKLNLELLSFIFSYFLYLVMFIFIGFLLKFFIFKLILKGFIGESMKNNLLKNISKYNNILVNFLIIYFIFVLSSNIIYLDTTLNLNFKNLDLILSDKNIDKIFTHFGAATAFVLGSKLAAGFLTKHSISIGSKIGLTILTGAGSSAVYQMVTLYL